MVPTNPALVQQVVDQPNKFMIEQFIMNGAKTLVGEIDLIKVEIWVNVTETASGQCKCPTNTKQGGQLACCRKLSFSGRINWRHYFQAEGNQLYLLGCVFTAFNKQYFPKPVVKQQVLDFSNLMERQCSLQEYARKFLALECFSLW